MRLEGRRTKKDCGRVGGQSGTSQRQWPAAGFVSSQASRRRVVPADHLDANAGETMIVLSRIDSRASEPASILQSQCRARSTSGCLCTCIADYFSRASLPSLCSPCHFPHSSGPRTLRHVGHGRQGQGALASGQEGLRLQRRRARLSSRRRIFARRRSRPCAPGTRTTPPPAASRN